MSEMRPAIQVKATKLLVDHHEEILPSAVVPALQVCCRPLLSVSGGSSLDLTTSLPLIPFQLFFLYLTALVTVGYSNLEGWEVQEAR